MLSGQVHGSRLYEAINNFVSDCFAAWRSASSAASSQGTLSVASFPTQPVPKGRAAIFAQAQTDSEDGWERASPDGLVFP